MKKFSVRPKIVLVMLTLLIPVQTFAIAQEDRHAVLYDTPYYQECTAAADSGGITASGSISPQVGKGMSASAQQKFQQILVAAGKKFNVDPNFIASFYYAENERTGDSTNNADSASGSPATGNGKWREPAPPYGHGPSWGRNGFTASGPFQFIDSTWAAYGVDGNGDGRKDQNDLADSGFAAAKYLAASGGKAGASDAQLRKAAFSYNQSSTYGSSVLNTFHYLSKGGSTNVSGSTGTGGDACGASSGTSGDIGGYKNPLRDIKGLGPSRIDEGVDYTGGGPVYALGAGVVTFASGQTSWPGGTYIIYQLKDGAAKGKYVYVAENCTVRVHQGQQVTSDTVLCDMHNAFPYIETGWSTSTQQTPMSSDVYHTVADGSATAYGVNFDALMHKLGAPAGIYQFPNQKGHPVGSLQSGWPTW